MSLYPRVMVSSLDPEWSLTIYNASSTPYTLTVMSVVALIFVPIVLAYQGVLDLLGVPAPDHRRKRSWSTDRSVRLRRPSARASTPSTPTSRSTCPRPRSP
jgi:hypothetical protein